MNSGAVAAAADECGDRLPKPNGGEGRCRAPTLMPRLSRPRLPSPIVVSRPRRRSLGTRGRDLLHRVPPLLMLPEDGSTMTKRQKASEPPVVVARGDGDKGGAVAVDVDCSVLGFRVLPKFVGVSRDPSAFPDDRGLLPMEPLFRGRCGKIQGVPVAGDVVFGVDSCAAVGGMDVHAHVDALAV